MQKDVIRQSYIQTEGNHFVRNGEKIILRGWALGSWMNFEHFMMGLPGTHSMILEAFEQVYGKERAGECKKVLTGPSAENKGREEAG